MDDHCQFFSLIRRREMLTSGDYRRAEGFGNEISIAADVAAGFLYTDRRIGGFEGTILNGVD
jgi:hypothetical protein